MAKVEVEHRGRLSQERFLELKEYFSKNAKFIGRKKRFSIIYVTSEDFVREVKDDPVDLKLRITNGKPEVALKYGKWSGKDARREFEFKIEKEQFIDFAEFLKILGYKKAVLMANTKYDYLYKGTTLSLVEVPDWGHYFEAEILVDENKIVSADQKVEKILSHLKLKVLNEEEFFELLDEFNNRPGYKVDLEKVKISELLKKYKDFI